MKLKAANRKEKEKKNKKEKRTGGSKPTSTAH
jgi:hypothetical protein